MVINFNYVRRIECDLDDVKADGLLLSKWKERLVTDLVSRFNFIQVNLPPLGLALKVTKDTVKSSFHIKTVNIS